MKPDKPGEWHERNGRRVLAYMYKDRLWVRPFDSDGPGDYASVLDGDWLPAIAPKFPELPPPKPALVLFTQASWGRGEKYWGAVEGDTLYVVSPKCGHGATYNLRYAKIVVIPHPDNDLEAVRLIEAAQKTSA